MMIGRVMRNGDYPASSEPCTRRTRLEFGCSSAFRFVRRSAVTATEPATTARPTERFKREALVEACCERSAERVAGAGGIDRRNLRGRDGLVRLIPHDVAHHRGRGSPP